MGYRAMDKPRGTARLNVKAVNAFVAKAEPGKKLSDGAGLYGFGDQFFDRE